MSEARMMITTITMFRRIAIAATILVAATSWAQTPAPGGPRRPQGVAASAVDWSQTVVYEYDGAGNVKKIGTDAYVYDAVGRLVSGSVSGVTQTYTYDIYGNRLTCEPSCQPQTIDTVQKKNRLTVGSGASGASYDERGNVLTLDDHTYTYDELGMIKRADVGSWHREYVYTADDERLAVNTVDTWWTWTVRGLDKKVLREFTSTGDGTAEWQWQRDNVYRDGQLTASQQKSGSTTTKHFYHLDHLGTPRLVTDAGGYTVGVHDYLPFGKEVPGNTTEVPATNLRFTGHERDFIDGQVNPVDYMHARYYSAQAGRFLSVDPTWDSADIRWPQSWNRYAYVLNNPINLTDPDGKCPTCRPEDLAKMAEIQRMSDAGDLLSQEMLTDGIEPTDGPAAFITGPSKAAGTTILAMASVFIKGGIRNVAREGGEAVVKRAMTSAIKNDNLLVKAAQAAGKSHQGSLDSLVGQLAKGNLKPGIGTRRVFGNVVEARAKDGARVYFRTGRDGGVEILAKSTKANQDQVINRLRELYGGK